MHLSPVNKVMTCPAVDTWLAFTVIDVYLTLDSLIPWCTGAGVEPNLVSTHAPVLARVTVTFIYFGITVYTFVTRERNIQVMDLAGVLSWDHKSNGIKPTLLEYRHDHG